MMGVSEHGMLDKVVCVLIFSKRPSKNGIGAGLYDK
jgi:hypothetical protein